jgi:general L-amino acid transport system permease protein
MTSSSLPRGQGAVAPWRDVRVLRVVAQVAVLLVVGLLVAFLARNLLTAMEDRGLGFGFGFLDSTAGFEIAETPVPYNATDTYGQAFLVGLLNTLFVSAVGIVLATLLGLVVGVARLSKNFLVNRVAGGYVELMRNTPLLVQLFFLYAFLLQLPRVAESIQLPGAIFLNQRGLSVPAPILSPTFGPWLASVAVGIVLAIAALRLLSGRPRWLSLVALVGIPAVAWVAFGQPLTVDVPVLQRFNFTGGLTLSSGFTALLAGLVLYTAAFIGEVVRGGIQAVRRGQVEAARALGLSEGHILRLVVFPQALRVIVPPLTSQYLNLAKNSSLAIAIGYPDLFSVSQTMANQTGQPVSVIVMVMATYLTISLVTSLLMNLYNRRVQVLER